MTAAELPHDWRCDWLKWHVNYVNEQTYNELDLPYLSNEMIESWTGRYSLPDTDQERADGRRFKPDDVLFNKLRPYLAKVVHADFDGVSSGELLCLRPSARVFPRFLFYYLVSERLIEAVNAATFGAKMPRADWEILGHQPLPLPRPDTQRRIAAFLDDATAQIDGLVKKKRRLLELLAEKRQSLVTRAVTKGLDPSTPTKPSGIDWLGDIPAHWEAFPLKRLLSTATYGISASLSSEGEVAVLRMGDIVEGRVVLDQPKFVDDVPDALLLRERDVLFNRTNSLALVGKAGLYDGSYPGKISFASYLVRMRFAEPNDPEFFNYVMNTPNVLEIARRLSLPSIGQANLNPSRYSQVDFPVPPPNEQKELIQYLNHETGKMISLSEKIKDSIAVLEEYRSALITAAVSGKIEGLR